MTGPRFVFRAAVVLDLRRRQDRDAQDALNRANAALELAERALLAAEADLRRALDQPVEEGTDRDWYRNWMVGLRAAIVRRTGEVTVRRRAREEALAQAIRARRSLRVIERLRDRRQRAFELDTSRREQRRIDELAVRRYDGRKRGSGGFT
jgi:flagellar export protein FliJ